MSAVLSLLRSRLLRPAFIALGIALLVQLAIALWLTRSTVDGLVSNLGDHLGNESQRLAGELEQAGREVTSGLNDLSARTRERLGSALSARLEEEQGELRQSLEQSLRQSATELAQLLAAVAPKAMWDNDVPLLSDYARRAQANPNVLFVVYDDPQGLHLTRYLNREDERVKALLEKGKGERALDKVLEAASHDSSVFLVEAPISPNGVEIGKVRLGVSTDAIEKRIAALDQRFSALVASGDQLVGGQPCRRSCRQRQGADCASAVGETGGRRHEPGREDFHRGGREYPALAHRYGLGAGWSWCAVVPGSRARSSRGESSAPADQCLE